MTEAFHSYSRTNFGELLWNYSLSKPILRFIVPLGYAAQHRNLEARDPSDTALGMPAAAGFENGSSELLPAARERGMAVAT